jgi:O-antigen/teichoic acid export membrane protein
MRMRSASNVGDMDRAEVEAYRERHEPIRAMIWWSFVLVALASGYGVGLAWSLLAGAVVTVALIGAFLRLQLWWDRARWLKRFPELADNPNVKWIRHSW